MSARPPALFLLALLLALLLAACSAAPSGAPASGGVTQSQADTAARQSEAANKGPVPAPPPVAPAGGAAVKPGAPALPAAAPTTAPAAAPAPTAVAGADRPAGAPLPALEQKIIRTGKIELVVPGIGGAIETITGIVTIAGGYVQQSATKEQTADLVLRVPVDQYDKVFSDLRKLAVQGTKIVESSDAQDVTEQFADTEARITNLKATEAQLLKLLARAEKMEDILVVQRELTSVREQIERLQGQLNVLSRRAAFSTIAVTLRPQEEAKKPAPPPLTAPVANAANIGVRPTFTWGTSTGATAYELQVATEVDTTFANPLLTADKLTVTTYEWPTTHEDLKQGASYRWRVRAVNAAGESDWATARAFTTVPAWTPLRTVGESWAASLSFLQRLIDGLLRFVVFFWWLILLVALGIPLVRRLGWRIGRRPAGPAPTPPPAPPAAPPAGSPPVAS
jgi:hypothetical protein